MDVGHTRPVEPTNDARSHRTRTESREFAPHRNPEEKLPESGSDAHTRLSREVDRAEISQEAQELMRRESPEVAEEPPREEREER